MKNWVVGESIGLEMLIYLSQNTFMFHIKLKKKILMLSILEAIIFYTDLLLWCQVNKMHL